MAIVVIMMISTVNGQSKLIHYWNFNNLTVAYHNPNIPALKADYSTIDTNKAQIVYKLATGASSTYAGYIDNVAGDTTNAKLGAVAGNALRVRNPSDSMELRFYIPTTNYKNIALKYAVQSSSVTSGQLAQLFDYSVDSGTTWKTSGLNMTIDSISQSQFQGTSWGLISLNFLNDTLANNNRKLVFRVKFAGNASMTSGNNRFENVTVQGDSVTATTTGPTAVITINNNGTTRLYPNPVTSDLHIEAAAGTKTIHIFDQLGKNVATISTTEKNTIVPTSNWSNGVYFVHIIDANGSVSQAKFIKQ